MAFTPGNSNGLLNGVTAVDVVPSPASGAQRMVRKVRVFNQDTAPVTLTLQYNDNGTARVLQKFTLAVGEAAAYEEIEVLDATTKKLQALLSGAAATLNPTYSTAWADQTP
jgi:hypothetical protein